MNSLRNFLIQLFNEGVHGNLETIFAWSQMLRSIFEIGLPQNLQEFQDDFAQSFANKFLIYNKILKSISLADTQAELEQLEEDQIIEIIPPYNEYRLIDHQNWVFEDDTDILFCGNDLSQEPLQFIRSRIQNFCEFKGISKDVKYELIIAITEAAENAIKYSDQAPVIISHGIENGSYFVNVYNSTSNLDVKTDINRGKFSEQTSLMRGVLVMSKLFDDLELNRDPESNVVVFKGVKNLSLN